MTEEEINRIAAATYEYQLLGSLLGSLAVFVLSVLGLLVWGAIRPPDVFDPGPLEREHDEAEARKRRRR